MSVLWCGQEPNDFPKYGQYIYNNTWGPPYRSGHSRTSLSLRPELGVVLAKPFSAGAQKTVWLTSQVWQDTYGYTGHFLVGLCNSNQAHGAGIWLGTGTSDGRKLRLFTWDGTTAATLAESASAVWSEDTLKKLDMEVSNYGASATVKVYVDAGTTPVINYSGDITVGTMVDIDCVGLRGKWNDSANERHTISEIIACLVDTRSLNLTTLVPSGAGDANGWTGAYTDIDDIYPSGINSLYVNSNGQAVQLAMSDLPAGDVYIWGIKIVARACAPNGSTPGKLKLGVKSGGSIDLDAGQAVGEYYDNVERWATKINGADLTPALVNAIQIAFESAA